MIRADFQENGAPNGFVRYVSKESWLYRREIGDFRLEPACIVLSVANPSDFNRDGVVDVNGIDLFTANRGNADLAFDGNRDGLVNQSDFDALVKVELNTFFGDADLDGEINRGDLVQVFQEDNYEVDMDAGWAQGDWTGDTLRRFRLRVSRRRIRKGPRIAVNAVPEPSSILLPVLGCSCVGFERLNIAFDTRCEIGNQ